MKRGVVAATGVSFLTLFVSCGGGGGGAAAGIGSKGHVLSTEGFDLAAGSGTALTVDVPSAGTLQATASWGVSGTDIDVYITDSACPSLDDLVLGSCTVLGRGDSPMSRSETATAVVQPGRYQAFVLALAEQGDSGVVEFALIP